MSDTITFTRTVEITAESADVAIETARRQMREAMESEGYTVVSMDVAKVEEID